MANENQYLPIANGPGADVESQEQYETDLAPSGSLEFGYKTGVALTQQFNKTVRQSSVASSALAQAVVDVLAVDMLDDGDVEAFADRIVAMIDARASAKAASTGDYKLTLKTVADAGWVMCNDGTIGNSASNGTARANADTFDLFALLWTNVGATYAPMFTSAGAPVAYGVSAAADFANNRAISLTKMLGRSLAVSGGGAGLTARALGQTDGAETVVLDTTMIPAHNHPVTDPGHFHSITGYTIYGSGGGTARYALNDGGLGGSNDYNTNNKATGITVGNTGGGAAHNNVQPTSFQNIMVKL